MYHVNDGKMKWTWKSRDIPLLIILFVKAMKRAKLCEFYIMNFIQIMKL